MATDDEDARRHTAATDEALREETRNLDALDRTGRTLASQFDLQALVQAVTDAATALSGAEFGAFFYNVKDENGDAFRLYTLSGAARGAFESFHHRATALFGHTFRGEPAILLHDVLTESRYGTVPPHHGLPEGPLAVRSYLAVPVSSRSGEVIGGLFFGHSTPGVFTERAQRLMVGVAAQAGIVIDNARIYERSRRAGEERERLLQSERAARNAAERLGELKDEFLATLSHELRTPLNAILGWAQVLRGTSKGADMVRGLEAIERNARLQAQLVEDLLDTSRVASGTLRLDVQPLQPLQLVSMIEAALETVAPAADAKMIRLESALDPTAGPIAGDPGRLQQVIWNLLSNAIKFTPNHGEVRVVLARADAHIEIRVADTGIGIAPDFIPHLFERFRQADASTTRRFGGLGLGLSIVKSLVELHGGRVQVQSAGEGLGTTVVVQLPMMVVEERSGAELRHPDPSHGRPAVPSDDFSALTILVVDNQPLARDLVQRTLEDCGAAVIAAGTAADALTIVERSGPDVLISTVGTPDLDGYELLEQVRALGPTRGGRVPAIALTVFARAEDRTRALRAGFMVLAAHPVDPAELVATVASVVGGTEPGWNPRR